MGKLKKGETLCGTCRWWDHETAVRREGPVMSNRIAPCLWGSDLTLPQWCDGLRGDRWTNELGITGMGCRAWERPTPPREAESR